MTISKIQAESMNLADAFAFTGTVSGAGDYQKVSSSTTTSAGITQYEVALPTTTDFSYLELQILGAKSTTASNTYWAVRLREQGESGALATSTSYRVLGSSAYSNNSGAGVSTGNADVDGSNFALLSGGYVGDGSDDFEMTNYQFKLYNTNNSTRYTRVIYGNTIEKRHTDAYHYHQQGSFVVSSANVLDRIYFLTNSVTAFTAYGYALYKVII